VANRPRWQTRVHDIRHVFLMTGAIPNTRVAAKVAWHSMKRAFRAHGAPICTSRFFAGADAEETVAPPMDWLPGTPTLHLETTIPGIFAVGDGALWQRKRVAAAVARGPCAFN